MRAALRRGRTAGALLCAVVLSVGLVPGAQAAQPAFAPPSAPGPALDVPAATLRASLACDGNLAQSSHTPVLLVPGTTLTPQEFAWNYEPALTALGIPYCAVTLPNHAMSDIQISAEYVVYAIRTMHATRGGKIDIIGHSQGGMLPRWALRFWPDARAMVDDDIGLAPSNHGTADTIVACAHGCAPSVWQQGTNANFIQALNSYQETVPGISYTVVYTHADEIVTPNANPQGSSSLHGGGGQIANVAIQDVCPADTSDHNATGTYDPVSYVIALDALSHAGPADPSRIDGSVCAKQFMPGVDPSTFPGNYAALLQTEGQYFSTYPTIPAEPPLMCYVTGSCPRSSGSATKRSAPKGHPHHRHHRHHRGRHHAERRRESPQLTG